MSNGEYEGAIDHNPLVCMDCYDRVIVTIPDDFEGCDPPWFFECTCKTVDTAVSWPESWESAAVGGIR